MVEKRRAKTWCPQAGSRKREVPSKWAASRWTTATCGGPMGRRPSRLIAALFKPREYSDNSSTLIPENAWWWPCGVRGRNRPEPIPSTMPIFSREWWQLSGHLTRQHRRIKRHSLKERLAGRPVRNVQRARVQIDGRRSHGYHSLRFRQRHIRVPADGCWRAEMIGKQSLNAIDPNLPAVSPQQALQPIGAK